MSYTIDQDGTIHRKPTYKPQPSSYNTQPPSNNYDSNFGCSFWPWIIGIALIIISATVGKNCNGNKSSNNNPACMDCDTVTGDTVDFVPSSSSSEIDTIASPPVEKNYDWSGTYKATTDAGSTYGGTPINYEITIKLEANDNSFRDYYGSIEVSGYMTYFTYPVTAYANKNVLRVRSGHNPDEDVQGIVEDSPIVTLYYYETNGMMESQWHQGLSEDYINNQTELRKVSN